MRKQHIDTSPSPMHVANILAVLNAAKAEEIAEGVAWYETANTFARGLSVKYNVPLDRCAGIIAAFSPVTPWVENQIRAERFIQTKGKFTGHTPENIAKARRILRGADILETLTSESSPNTGHKVRNFFACILDPTCEAVCVDRHAWQLAEAKAGNDEAERSNALRRVGVYARVANAYRAVAENVGMTPSQVQAITWVAWRNLKGDANRLEATFA